MELESQAARILRDAGSEQGEVGKAASVERELVDGALIDQGRDGTGRVSTSGGAPETVTVSLAPAMLRRNCQFNCAAESTWIAA